LEQFSFVIENTGGTEKWLPDGPFSTGKRRRTGYGDAFKPQRKG
jgi:hypothetical protein